MAVRAEDTEIPVSSARSLRDFRGYVQAMCRFHPVFLLRALNVSIRLFCPVLNLSVSLYSQVYEPFLFVGL
jgi:hypothetical protein